MDYYTFTNEIVTSILDQDIYISSIIVDNLRAQTKGIDFLIKSSTDKRITPIIIVHCFCHLISLVFTNTIKACPHLQELISDIKTIINILRKNSSVQFIGKKCPCIVETRWIYLYDVLNFIVMNSEDIATILTLNKIEFKLNEYNQLLNLILPLRCFVEKMESNNSICCVGKYVYEMLDYFKRGDFHLISDIFQSLYTILLARIQSNNFDLVITSYFFSSSGRAHFRRMNIRSISGYNSEEPFVDYPRLFGNRNAYEIEPENNDNFRLFLEKSINNLDSEIINTSLLDDEIENDESSFISQNYKSILNDLLKKN